MPLPHCGEGGSEARITCRTTGPGPLRCPPSVAAYLDEVNRRRGLRLALKEGRTTIDAVQKIGGSVPSYKSVDALQNALASGLFSSTAAPKKAAGRALGTLLELVTFYLIRDWGLEGSLAIERGLAEYGNPNIRHNVEFTLHPAINRSRILLDSTPASLTARRLNSFARENGATYSDVELRTTTSLLKNGIIRHACVFADGKGSFIIAHAAPDLTSFDVVELATTPYAMFECKRVGVEEGQRKGPQTIEKAKQGAYVARSVSGLQRVPRRDGSVAAVVEAADGTLSIHNEYNAFLRNAIDARDSVSLSNVVVTVGVVSNHGNWFTADSLNKEMHVLAQSYDWLLFLTDEGLAEFIETALLGTGESFAATRRAFAASFARSSGTTRFTKVTIDAEADMELTSYFAKEQPWERWINVITPRAPIGKLRADLLQLRGIHESEWSGQ